MIKLNCDLGEGYGAWKMPQDQFIMPYIDMANIACGFHAGDPLVIQQTIEWAKKSNVSIGAHPSYPDKQGFGRRSMKIPPAELIAIIHYQIAALQGMANVQNMSVDYVKPHGALYNDMMQDIALFTVIVTAIRDFSPSVPLLIQSTPNWKNYRAIADAHQVKLIFEAFADRAYTDDGLLVSRQQPNALLSLPQTLEQVENLVNNQTIITESGRSLTLKVDTLCVHGDSENALEVVKSMSKLLSD